MIQTRPGLAALIPALAISGAATGGHLGGAPVRSGPFRLEDWATRDRIALRRVAAPRDTCAIPLDGAIDQPIHRPYHRSRVDALDDNASSTPCPDDRVRREDMRRRDG